MERLQRALAVKLRNIERKKMENQMKKKYRETGLVIVCERIEDDDG